MQQAAYVCVPFSLSYFVQLASPKSARHADLAKKEDRRRGRRGHLRVLVMGNNRTTSIFCAETKDLTILTAFVVSCRAVRNTRTSEMAQSTRSQPCHYLMVYNRPTNPPHLLLSVCGMPRKLGSRTTASCNTKVVSRTRRSVPHGKHDIFLHPPRTSSSEAVPTAYTWEQPRKRKTTVNSSLQQHQTGCNSGEHHGWKGLTDVTNEAYQKCFSSLPTSSLSLDGRFMHPSQTCTSSRVGRPGVPRLFLNVLIATLHVALCAPTLGKQGGRLLKSSRPATAGRGLPLPPSPCMPHASFSPSLPSSL